MLIILFSDTTSFSLQVSTSNGTLILPQVAPSITLSGRQSKVIVTDYKFGTSSKALYSTASVFFAGQIGGRDVLFLFGDSDQEHETALALTGTSGVRTTSSLVRFTSKKAGSGSDSIVNFMSGIKGLVTVWDSSTQLVLFADTDTAGTFFAPVLPPASGTGDAATFKNYWQIGSNETVLVGGPYLVRNASISGSELALRGDLNASVMLTVIAPPTVRAITWNGQPVEANAKASSAVTSRGGFAGQLQLSTSASGVHVPSLSNWKFADSLPEIQASFSDAAWIVANHTTTNIPDKPLFGDGRVLYGCDYGLFVFSRKYLHNKIANCPFSCENAVLWRGHFNATGSEKSVNLSINGGEGEYTTNFRSRRSVLNELRKSIAFAASVWLNNVFLNTSFGK